MLYLKCAVHVPAFRWLQQTKLEFCSKYEMALSVDLDVCDKEFVAADEIHVELKSSYDKK